MSKFKEGDTVICIDVKNNIYLFKGEEYEVTGIKSTYVTLKGFDDYCFYEGRFELKKTNDIKLQDIVKVSINIKDIKSFIIDHDINPSEINEKEFTVVGFICEKLSINVDYLILRTGFNTLKIATKYCAKVTLEKPKPNFIETAIKYIEKIRDDYEKSIIIDFMKYVETKSIKGIPGKEIKIIFDYEKDHAEYLQSKNK